MRTVNAHLFSSIDGVVSDPHLFQFDSFGADEAQMMTENMAAVTEAILGRTVYQEWAAYWPEHNEDFGLTINPMTQHVASTTLTAGDMTWENSSLIEGDLLDFVRELKQAEGGDITVVGISIIRQLLVAGLLDQLILTVHPTSGGAGRRLFDGVDEPFRLELVEGRLTAVGNAIPVYRAKA